GFSVRRLALFAEMPATRFGSVERVDGQQLGEFQVVGDAPGIFKVLVERAVRAGDRDVVPEFVAKLRYPRKRFPKGGFISRHPDVIPEHGPQLAMQLSRRLCSLV